jgi:uncharacterized membrane protein
MTPDSTFSSTGLSSRTAAALAYSGWWVTGAIFWFVERRDRFVRFHAAQAVVVFGLAALLVGLFGALAVASLAFLPEAFNFFVLAATATWAAAVGLWVVAMWKAAGGHVWQVPVAAGWAERLDARFTASAPASV